MYDPKLDPKSKRKKRNCWDKRETAGITVTF